MENIVIDGVEYCCNRIDFEKKNIWVKTKDYDVNNPFDLSKSKSMALVDIIISVNGETATKLFFYLLEKKTVNVLFNNEPYKYLVGTLGFVIHPCQINSGICRNTIGRIELLAMVEKESENEID